MADSQFNPNQKLRDEVRGIVMSAIYQHVDTYYNGMIGRDEAADAAADAVIARLGPVAVALIDWSQKYPDSASFAAELLRSIYVPAARIHENIWPEIAALIDALEGNAAK